MKRLILVLFLALILNGSVCVSDANATFWFYYNPMRALIWYANCYLTDTTNCEYCQNMDLNKDCWVDLADYAILTEQE